MPEMLDCTVQGPVPDVLIPKSPQNPSHPENVELPLAVAVIVNCAFSPKSAVQGPLVMAPFVTVQVGPPGVIVRVPLPFPIAETVIEDGPKLAVTLCAALIVTVQVGVTPGHVVVDPFTVHPVKAEPAFPSATRVTCWPTA
jgi:hypothetical protein